MYMYLTQALHRAISIRPNAPATVSNSRRQTYAMFTERVARLAAGLQSIGMKTGDRVGMLALNSDRYLEYYMGTWWGGGVVNPVNTRWSAAEIAYSLDDCDTQILLVDDTFLGMVGELRRLSKSLCTLVYVGDKAPPDGILSFEQLVQENAPVADAIRTDDDIAGVFYTGGTTGFPKGVVLTHTNLVSNSLGGLSEIFVEENAIFLHVAPLFHLAALSIVLQAFLRATVHVMLPSFTPLGVLESIARERITIVLMVPTMIQMVTDYPNRQDFDCSSLKRLGYGGSPISEAVLDRALTAFPGVAFSQGYGMTEMSAGVSYLLAEHHAPEWRARGKLRSAGRPICGVEVQILDPSGERLPVGSIGEVVTRSAGMMKEYWNKPKETEAALRDGWMHTGDVGYMDQDGFLYIVDRIKDMIVTGAENVYSAEVENAIARHHAVAACAVIGIPDEKWGEAVHAVVVVKPGQSVKAEEITAHCRTLIAGYKCPRSVEFRDQLPISGAGKVLKFKLRERFLDGKE